MADSNGVVYTAMSSGGGPASPVVGGGVGGFANSLSGAHERVSSLCTRRLKFLLLTVFSFVSIVFTCAALGAPWLVITNSSSGSGTITTTVTLSQWTNNACVNNGGCTKTSGTTLGTAKAAGDPVLGLLTLSLVVVIYLFGASLLTLLSLGKFGSGPLGLAKVQSLRTQTAAVTLVTLACTIAYPATALPAVPVGFPGSLNVSAAYGGGFACALMTFLMLAPMTLMLQGMVDEEAAYGTSGNNGGSGTFGHAAVHLPYAPTATDASVATAPVGADDASAKFTPYGDVKVGEYAAGGFQAGSYHA